MQLTVRTYASVNQTFYARRLCFHTDPYLPDPTFGIYQDGVGDYYEWRKLVGFMALLLCAVFVANMIVRLIYRNDATILCGTFYVIDQR